MNDMLFYYLLGGPICSMLLLVYVYGHRYLKKFLQKYLQKEKQPFWVRYTTPEEDKVWVIWILAALYAIPIVNIVVFIGMTREQLYDWGIIKRKR